LGANTMTHSKHAACAVASHGTITVLSSDDSAYSNLLFIAPPTHIDDDYRSSPPRSDAT